MTQETIDLIINVITALIAYLTGKKRGKIIATKSTN